MLEQRRILVVEDEYLLAQEICEWLQGAGVTVVGPAATIAAALEAVRGTTQIDAALVDLNLRGEMAYPVADALRQRGIRFVFLTGYDSGAIPARYKDVDRCEKPLDRPKVVHALFG